MCSMWRPGVSGRYLPAESDSGMSAAPTARPIWMLVRLHLALLHTTPCDAFKIECPTGSGRLMTFTKWPRRSAPAQHVLRQKRGAVYGGTQKFQEDSTGATGAVLRILPGDNGAAIWARQTMDGIVARSACSPDDGRTGHPSASRRSSRSKAQSDLAAAAGIATRGQNGIGLIPPAARGHS